MENAMGDDLFARKTVLPQVLSEAEECDTLYKLFQQTQLEGDSSLVEAKANLVEKLDHLNHQLNHYLAKDYGKKPDKEKEYEAFLQSHQPFHWFVEFYGIMKDGGFDAVIGNPPYVNTKEIEYAFLDDQYKTESSKDLFALTVERSYLLGKHEGMIGLIIPLSITSTNTMLPARNLLKQKSSRLWTSYYSASDQPASLFTGVRHRLSIILASISERQDCVLETTRFLKWFSEERPSLFPAIVNYTNATTTGSFAFPKTGSKIAQSILRKIQQCKQLSHYMTKHGTAIYFHNAPVHWGKCFDFIPMYRIGKNESSRSSHLKDISFPRKEYAAFSICLLNSSFFYWYNWQFTNCRDLALNTIQTAPADLDKLQNGEKFVKLKNNRFFVDFHG